MTPTGLEPKENRRIDSYTITAGVRLLKKCGGEKSLESQLYLMASCGDCGLSVWRISMKWVWSVYMQICSIEVLKTWLI